MAEPRNTRLIKDGSFGSERSKLSGISQLSHGSHGSCPDWTAHFYIVSRFVPEPFPRYSAINLMQLTDHCNLSAPKPVHCFPWHARHCTSVAPTQRTCLRTPRLSLQRQWSLHIYSLYIRPKKGLLSLSDKVLIIILKNLYYINNSFRQYSKKKDIFSYRIIYKRFTNIEQDIAFENIKFL